MKEVVKMGKIETEYGIINENVVWKLIDSLQRRAKKIEQLSKQLKEIAKNGVDAEETVVLDTLMDLCDLISDCLDCPLQNSCELSLKGCEEVDRCEFCPRIRICVSKRCKGLIEYVSK
jgi:adenine-specific DNA glycosylase